MIRRCVVCRRLIWPWSRIGWIVRDDRTESFHPRCHSWRRNQAQEYLDRIEEEGAA